MIVINAKNYETGVGKALLSTLSSIQSVQEISKKRFCVAVNSIDLSMACEHFAHTLDIFAQHCDNATMGASTGKIIPEYLKQIGVKGVILNHSENRFLNTDILIQTISCAKGVGLEVIVCAESVPEGSFFSQNSLADWIAVEPPELIGGEISVSSARPEIIDESIATIGSKKVLIGAGIKNAQDIAIVTEKGGMGVLLSSGIMKSSNIISALKGLL